MKYTKEEIQPTLNYLNNVIKDLKEAHTLLERYELNYNEFNTVQARIIMAESDCKKLYEELRTFAQCQRSDNPEFVHRLKEMRGESVL